MARYVVAKLYSVLERCSTWLTLAHRTLDQAVLDAYGWPHDLSDEDILARLLALNLERAGADPVAGGSRS